MPYYSSIISSPIGNLGIICQNDVLCQLDFLPTSFTLRQTQDRFVLEVIEQLMAYFNEPRFNFCLPLIENGTAFQQIVWQQMRTIPIGHTHTYGQLAKALNSSARAIGNACRRNPLPIITPCHRVVGANKLGGYSGQTSGDIWSIKQWLLQHEQAR
jgi:methylated-DNA-[protein]-cysteine S-methyltransferase